MADEIFDPQQRDDLTQHLTPPPFLWSDFLARNKVIVGTIAVAALAVLVAAVVLIRSWGPPAVVSNNVLVSIKAPSQINAGNEAEYTIVYRNGENSDLADLTLELFYPSGVTFKAAVPAPTSSGGNRFTLPPLKAGESGRIQVRLRVSGATGEIKLLAAKLTYRLLNFNSEFEVRAQTESLVLAPNLTLDISGPVEVVSGQDTTLALDFANVSTETFDNLVLEVTYPEGFSFISSQPPPSQGQNVFAVPQLPVGGLGRIEITGSFSGETGAEQLVVGQLGQTINNKFAPQLAATASFKLTGAPLTLRLAATPSDTVLLNQNVEFHLDYANTSNVSMTNVVIVLTLQSTILDWSRLSVYNAIVAGQTITWKSATLNNLAVLAPSQRGEITFSVPIKSNLTTNLKQLTIKAQGSVQSDQLRQVVRAPELELRLTSQLGVLVSGQDLGGDVYGVNFLVTNLSNDVAEARLTASLLLPSSAWTAQIDPAEEQGLLTFDANSGLIRWAIGDLPAYSGKYTPARSVTFQLLAPPGQSAGSSWIRLLSDIAVTGVDTFTNSPVEARRSGDFTTADIP